MKYSNEELNTTAMQIILHAGNGRTILNSIFDQLDGDAESLLKEAKKKLPKLINYRLRCCRGQSMKKILPQPCFSPMHRTR